MYSCDEEAFVVSLVRSCSEDYDCLGDCDHALFSLEGNRETKPCPCSQPTPSSHPLVLLSSHLVDGFNQWNGRTVVVEVSQLSSHASRFCCRHTQSSRTERIK